jgi:hypothetical protein
MASYDGNTAMMGNQAALQSFAVLAPMRRQRVTFAGVDGVLDKPLGTQGGRVLVRGVLEGWPIANLLFLESYWYGYQRDGGAYTLIDSAGRSWGQAVLVQYRPTSETYFDGYSYCRDFEADFDLLT